jgi:beta-glucosidase
LEYALLHGYTKLEADGNAPRFAFGEGKSYTSFSLTHPTFWVESNEGHLSASVHVTNTGNVRGDEVIQFYVGFAKSSILRPRKILVSFRRVSLEPGETILISLGVPQSNIHFYNEEQRKWEFEKMSYEGYIGSSSKDCDLCAGIFPLESLLASHKSGLNPASRL